MNANDTPKPEPAPEAELSDQDLEKASGGIIAILIGKNAPPPAEKAQGTKDGLSNT